VVNYSSAVNAPSFPAEDQFLGEQTLKALLEALEALEALEEELRL
jgi:hypothetical protein